MDVAWGDSLSDSSGGQDILGVRGLDQAIEARLVNGLTTISQRGRYLTTLPWALGAYFADERAAGRDQHDQDRLVRFLFRIEFLTLAASKLVEQGADAFAALGAVKFAGLIADLRDSGSVTPPTGASSPMLNTYFGPCQRLGMLGAGEGTEPYRLTPRGQAIWRAREDSLPAGPLDRLLEADSWRREDVESLVDQFALQRLASADDEAALLRDALLTPWPPEAPNPAVAEAYDRFAGTLRWLETEAATSDIKADTLLADVWRRAASGELVEPGVQMAWAEYEWRRRLHFALELMLAAVASEVRVQGQATVDDLIAGWTTEDMPPILSEAWPDVQAAASRSAGEAADSVPVGLWVGLLPDRSLAMLTNHGRALAAYALVVALGRQSAALRQAGLFEDHETWGEYALAAVEDDRDGGFADALRRLAAVAVEAHLTTTFRKMSGGMKCSLRLFPEGGRLCATGMETGAGRSGPRLWNVIRILRDAGVDGLGMAE